MPPQDLNLFRRAICRKQIINGEVVQNRIKLNILKNTPWESFCRVWNEFYEEMLKEKACEICRIKIDTGK